MSRDRESTAAASKKHAVTGNPSQVPTIGDNPVDAVDNSAVGSPSVDASEEPLRGSDLARAALKAAQEQTKSRPRGRPRKNRTAGARRKRGWSGPGGDDRDPQQLGRLASRIAAEHGWTERLSGGQVFDRWVTLVGDEVAEHTTPVALEEGELTVRAESTAWATQLRLLQRQIIKRISDGLGRDVVRRIRVQGPAAPSWRYGPKHVPGRGPRDTYG